MALEQPRTVIVREGDPLRVRCHTTSPVQLTSYVWWPPKAVSLGVRELQQNELFFLPNVSRMAAGVYVCLANNSEGSTKARVEVAVKGRK